MKISQHFQERSPSVIRKAQIEYSKREDKDSINVINMAIGNISMPMYPAMRDRMIALGVERIADGIVRYTPTPGTEEARKAFLNILSAEGFETKDIFSLVTDGGSSAMELMLLGICGPSSKRPILFLDPTYTNYKEFAKRLSIPTVSSIRPINDDGTFSKLNLKDIESLIIEHDPAGILIIPYDNPTGQFLSYEIIKEIAKIVVKHDIWLVSDEAYRSLSYTDGNVSSIWILNDKEVQGIKGRRVSIESASKVWNACGLRIGALLTDNKELHEKAISEYTANLCANTLGQEIFGALANESHQDIIKWQKMQNNYYKTILMELKTEFELYLPGIIVTEPEAAIYFIIDFKNITDNNFSAGDFIEFCAKKGKVELNGQYYTLLLAPMSGFYNIEEKGRTQLRVAMVETPDKMKLAPIILSKLFAQYLH